MQSFKKKPRLKLHPASQPSPKETIENFTAIANLLVKFAIGAGVAILFSYLAFRVHFFPSGVAIGDSLLFIFAALGFGLIYSIWVGVGYLCVSSAAILWRQLKSKRPKKGTESTEGCAAQPNVDEHVENTSLEERAINSIDSRTGSSGKADSINSQDLPHGKIDLFLYFLISVSFFALLLWAGGMSDFSVALGALIGGFILTLAIDQPREHPEDGQRNRNNTKNRRRMLLAGFLAPGVLAFGFLPTVTQWTFGFFGIYIEKASLELNEKNFALVEAVAKQNNIPIMSCNLAKDVKLVHGFRVWWHGIGERSLVELAVKNKEIANAKIELDRTGIRVIRWDKKQGALETCLSLPADSAFDSYSTDLNYNGKQRIDAIKAELKQLLSQGTKITKITVIGHSDRRPIYENSMNNYLLSQKRAQAVADGLHKDFNVTTIVSGVGPSEPKVTCEEKVDKRIVEECLAPNRRVELRVQADRD